MEFVPFYFSESVCELLKNNDDLEILCRNNPDCQFWNAAIEKHIDDIRPIYNLQIEYFAREWSHRFCEANETDLAFNEVLLMEKIEKRLKKRRLSQKATEQRPKMRSNNEADLTFNDEGLIVMKEGFTFNQLAERGNCHVKHMSLCINYAKASSNLKNHHFVPDIKEFLNNLVSFIYKTNLEIVIKPSYAQLYHETPLLIDALAILFNRSFREISVQGDYLSLVENLIVAQLDSRHLEELYLPDACADELRKKIEKSMTTIPSTSKVFPLKFEKFSEEELR